MYQTLTQQALVGGEVYEEILKGNFAINTNSSLASSKVGLVDEFEKGSASTLASLLGLLNEREVHISGNQTIKARTEAIYSTSNAILPEIFQLFIESGQRSTAEALLNRFQFKVFVYNRLPKADRLEILNRVSEQNYRKARGKFESPSTEKSQACVKPGQLDFHFLAVVAKGMLHASDDFKIAFDEFETGLHEKTKEVVVDSEARHLRSRKDEPYVYVPSAEQSERLRQQIYLNIDLSAFLDLLLSNLADDAHLETLKTKTLEIGPTSLWRASYMMTTVGPGRNRLTFDKDNKLTISWGEFPQDSHLMAREQWLHKHLKGERERFLLQYTKVLTELTDSLTLASTFGKDHEASEFDFESDDFELFLPSFRKPSK